MDQVSKTIPDVVVLVPVLNRPRNARRLLDSFEAATPELCDLLFIASLDDRNEKEELERQGARYIVLEESVRDGDYARKINFGYRSTKNPWLFLGADDLHFHPGWLPAAAAMFSTPRFSVIGTQDMGNS